MDTMTVLNWNHHSEIENPRNHPFESVERLRGLLANGSTVQADRSRDDFFEVHDDDIVYYVYASPFSGKIFLVATWQKERSPVSV
jgi:hypothetical protein